MRHSKGIRPFVGVVIEVTPWTDAKLYAEVVSLSTTHGLKSKRKRPRIRRTNIFKHFIERFRCGGRVLVRLIHPELLSDRVPPLLGFKNWFATHIDHMCLNVGQYLLAQLVMYFTCAKRTDRYAAPTHHGVRNRARHASASVCDTSCQRRCDKISPVHFPPIYRAQEESE